MQHKHGVRLGRPFGSPLSVHPSWLPAAALLVAHLSLTVFGGHPLGTSLALSTVTGVGIFLCVVAHECGHALAARRTGLDLAGTTLYVFGGVHTFTREPASVRKEVGFALAGPGASVVVGALSLFAGMLVRGTTLDIVWVLGMSNIALAALNLLPGLPLDGGRLVLAWLSIAQHDRFAAARSAARMGRVVGLGIAAVGAWFFYDGLPVLAEASPGLWLAVTGLAVALVAGGMTRASTVVSSLSQGVAGDWARPFTGRVSIDAIVPEGGGPFAVSENGRLAGIVYGATPGTPARQAMVRWRPELGCPASTPVMTALERMAMAGTGVVVVLDEHGVVKGVLSEAGVRARLRAVT